MLFWRVETRRLHIACACFSLSRTLVALCDIEVGRCRIGSSNLSILHREGEIGSVRTRGPLRGDLGRSLPHVAVVVQYLGEARNWRQGRARLDVLVDVLEELLPRAVDRRRVSLPGFEHFLQ